MSAEYRTALARLPARIAAKIAPPDENGCWPWTACCDKYGYGQIRLEGKTQLAHRVVYQLLVGPIPDGLTLDHVQALGCASTACVNPAHLEPVTRGVNTMRGDTIPARRAAQTHCESGHAFDKANTYRQPDGTRKCRACNRDAVRRYKARKSQTH